MKIPKAYKKMMGKKIPAWELVAHVFCTKYVNKNDLWNQTFIANWSKYIYVYLFFLSRKLDRRYLSISCSPSQNAWKKIRKGNFFILPGSISETLDSLSDTIFYLAKSQVWLVHKLSQFQFKKKTTQLKILRMKNDNQLHHFDRFLSTKKKLTDLLIVFISPDIFHCTKWSREKLNKNRNNAFFSSFFFLNDNQSGGIFTLC